VTVAKAAAMVKAGDARDARGCGVVSGEKNVAGFVRALVSVGLSAINYSIHLIAGILTWFCFISELLIGERYLCVVLAMIFTAPAAVASSARIGLAIVVSCPSVRRAWRMA
jgi:hypothetical protein